MATMEVRSVRVSRDARALVSCEACGQEVVPERNSRLWWLAVIATWVFTLGIAPIVTIFPMSFVGIPLLFGIAMPLVSFTSEKVHAPPRCPCCHRYVD